MLKHPAVRPLPEIAAVYLSVAGDLDYQAAESLRERIANAFDQTDDTVVLDCSRVRFTDTGGLRLLLEATRTAHAKGIRFVLSKPSRPLRHLLCLAGVTDFLHIDDYDCTVEPPRPAVVSSRGPAIHAFPVAHAL